VKIEEENSSAMVWLLQRLPWLLVGFEQGERREIERVLDGNEGEREGRDEVGEKRSRGQGLHLPQLSIPWSP